MLGPNAAGLMLPGQLVLRLLGALAPPLAPRMTPSVLLYLRALVFYTGVVTTLCVFAPLAP
ncbi:MAG: hypothetical protein ACT4QB_15450 [Gammaproteobacteria bacterium]